MVAKQPALPVSDLLSQEPIAWIHVEVTSAEPRFRDGEAWVLPAGAPGSDDIDDLTHTDIDDGQGRLPVLVEGRYDVGYRTGYAGVFHQPGVVVTAGRGARVSFTVPAMGTATLRWENARDDWRLMATIAPEPRLPPTARHYPGRNEAASFGAFTTPLFSDAPFRWPIPAGQRQHIVTQVYLRNGSRMLKDVGARVTPTVVRAGDDAVIRTATLFAVPLRLTWTHADPNAHASIRLEQHGQPVAYKRGVSPAHERVVLHGYAGPARLVWEGRGVSPGGTDLTLIAGRNAEVPIDIEGSGRVTEYETKITYSFSDTAAPVPDEWVMHAAWFRGADIDAEVTDAPTMTLRGRTPRHSTPMQRCVFHALGHVATRATLQPGSTHDIELSPGGYLALILDRDIDPDSALGMVRLTRADGYPVWVRQEHDDPYAVAWVSAQTGTTIGPMRPGEHALRLFRGSVLLGTLRTTVTAGRTRPLVIR